MKTRNHWAVAMAVVAALGAGTVAHAEKVQVKYPNANLLSKKSGGSDRLAKLSRGDSLEVLGREGTWFKVRAGGREGYVHENAVTLPGQGLKGTGGKSGTVLSSAEAAKGIGESLTWARATGKDPSGLNRMIALRDEVKSADFDAFATEGNVGSARK